jgi:DNA-binding transcriptional LysR family regulator
MPRNLEIRLIRTFVAAADYSSMTAAANALDLTQGAVSQQIARLEASLGCSLLKRSRRGLRPTVKGERLLLKGRQLLALNDEIWANMRGDPTDGHIRLGVPYDLVGTYLPPVLKTYAEAFPRVKISLHCASSTELAEALENGEIDITLLEEERSGSLAECLAVERLVWVGATAGTAHLRHPLPLSMVAETCVFRKPVLSALALQKREWSTIFENGSMEATMGMVRNDFAITACLSIAVPRDLDVLMDVGLPDLPEFSIGLLVRKQNLGAVLAQFARHVRKSLRAWPLSAEFIADTGTSNALRSRTDLEVTG